MLLNQYCCFSVAACYYFPLLLLQLKFAKLTSVLLPRLCMRFFSTLGVLGYRPLLHQRNIVFVLYLWWKVTLICQLTLVAFLWIYVCVFFSRVTFDDVLFPYMLGRENRVTRNRYSPLLFPAPICACKNNRRTWHHNASISHSHDATMLSQKRPSLAAIAKWAIDDCF